MILYPLFLIDITFMLGVSTCWRSRSLTDGDRIIRDMAQIGAKAVELDYRLSPAMLSSALKTMDELGIKPLSMHAVCPASGDKKSRNHAEVFMICAPDENERRSAVREVADCLKAASGLGINAVALHCGIILMERLSFKLQSMYDDGSLHTQEGRRVVDEFKARRMRERGTVFDQLLKSLEEINEHADRLGVLVGVENRYYMEELPNFDEFRLIFDRMKGSNIRYWHDTGHAQVQENLGVTPHEAYLAEFSGLLIGVHLHDVKGYSDHSPPPMNTSDSVDFEMVKMYLKPDTIRILELKESVSAESAGAGLSWLSANGF
jgi:sugar phosphate isomerase/epimerase